METIRKPKHICRQTTQHGKVVYYYRPARGRRMRLDGAYGSPEFWSNYALAASGALPGERPINREQRNKQRDIALCVRQSLMRAKLRAKKKGMAFDLTEEWLLGQMERQGFKCALSGIPFLTEKGEYRARAFAPSIDRIDNAWGYTTDNVRIVAFAVNVMLLDWGEEVFYQVVDGCRGVRRSA